MSGGVRMRMFDILNFAAGRLYGEKDTEKEKPAKWEEKVASVEARE